MKIYILCVGKLKREFLPIFNDYYKRVSFFVEIIEFKNLIKLREKLESIDNLKNVFICHDSGKEYSSFEFADLIKKKEVIYFVIGSAEGFDFDISKYNLISFSKMVFTHQLFRIMLIEQIYRAKALNEGHSFPK